MKRRRSRGLLRPMSGASLEDATWLPASALFVPARAALVASPHRDHRLHGIDHTRFGSRYCSSNPLTWTCALWFVHDVQCTLNEW